MPRDEDRTPTDQALAVNEAPRNLGDLLQRIAQVASDRDEVYLATIMDALGTRSFGPVLLLIGVILVSPLSGLPGMPTTMGIGLVLISLQLVMGREAFWLPRWLLQRHVASHRLQGALEWLDRPARFIDWWLRPRLSLLASNGGAIVIAAVCLLLGLSMPVMELVPFSATAAGLAVVAFGLALVAIDGLFVILGLFYLLTVASLAVAGLVAN
ncbi:exopolysaccharide biosynthesis protein [Guyparkeria hydrothermalis]|uniref:Exopolysaccharide biosynthesis protein n=1 Tax=Guyparkeria halophila TaxID=47960 RepID=A0A6I6D2Q4_9GAMM|nr:MULTISPECIES: exopolysaccharide biosynthesis protein [Guyparkeria]MCL7752087.1 exopolysaccharide biosynthesis protein [Guyparkeria hydrothermalis]QGT78447.1 exopolysaccharide biosynthesis protein [Guyparkeria halophila]TKA91284.1 exopolysaccharide biosynthesis protein [Guyparkeria sp. SB14A]